MKRVLTILTVIAFLFAGCASQKQQSAHCGTKKQKKQRHQSMKSGRAPGGNMLN